MGVTGDPANALLDELTARIGADADGLVAMLLRQPGHSPEIVLAILGAAASRVMLRLPAERRATGSRHWLDAFEVGERV
jgi:hypothetical protein